MSKQALTKQIRRWVSTLMWLRHNGYRWKTNDAGGLYTIAFDQKEEKEWISCLPAEYQDIVRATADQETERLESVSSRMGCNFSELMLQNRGVI